jgi:hypothetical protein
MQTYKVYKICVENAESYNITETGITNNHLALKFYPIFSITSTVMRLVSVSVANAESHFLRN